MTILFVSDLHFSQQRPEKIQLFKQLLQGPAKQADALYILGDLFDDFWLGCDDLTEPKPEIIALLQEYSKADQTQLLIMRGNRDFHLDHHFAIATGSRLIVDPHLLSLANQTILLMHGDTLCTDDLNYQKWRRFITHPLIKWIYAKIPLGLRQRIARNVRTQAIETVQKKLPEIMDVAHETVLTVMNQYQVDVLIHGHTHRQAMHEIDLNGKKAMRIVLGDWYKKDCILIYDETGFRFERVEDYLKAH